MSIPNLTERVRDKDESVLGEIFETCKRRVPTKIDEMVADDMAQEVTIWVWENFYKTGVTLEELGMFTRLRAEVRDRKHTFMGGPQVGKAGEQQQRQFTDLDSVTGDLARKIPNPMSIKPRSLRVAAILLTIGYSVQESAELVKIQSESLCRFIRRKTVNL